MFDFLKRRTPVVISHQAEPPPTMEEVITKALKRGWRSAAAVQGHEAQDRSARNENAPLSARIIQEVRAFLDAGFAAVLRQSGQRATYHIGNWEESLKRVKFSVFDPWSRTPFFTGYVDENGWSKKEDGGAVKSIARERVIEIVAEHIGYKLGTDDQNLPTAPAVPLRAKSTRDLSA